MAVWAKSEKTDKLLGVGLFNHSMKLEISVWHYGVRQVSISYVFVWLTQLKIIAGKKIKQTNRLRK